MTFSISIQKILVSRHYILDLFLSCLDRTSDTNSHTELTTTAKLFDNRLSHSCLGQQNASASIRTFSSNQLSYSQSEMHPVNGTSPHRAFIALGSNVGSRVEMIEKACLEMDRANIKVKRTSSLFETAPMYVLDQDPFMNGVCEVSQPTYQPLPYLMLLSGRNLLRAS